MMMSVIASQIIPQTATPTVGVMATSVEGQAKFIITNNSSKTVTMYYKRDTDAAYITYTAGPTSQIKDLEAPPGKVPGDEMSIMCYAKADDEAASTIVEVDNVYFLPRTTTSPTVTGNPSATDPGWAVFNIKNEDVTKVRVYYKLLTDSGWNSDNTLNSGDSMNLSYEGNPGDEVTLQVYCQSETETTYVSTTVSKTTTYKVVTLLTPAITELSTTTIGQIRFQLTHNNGYAVDIRYKIGSASYVTLSSVPPFDIDNPDSIKIITHSNNPITPGDDVTIQAFSTKTGYTDSSVNSKTLTYLNYPQVDSPYILLLNTDVLEEIKFRMWHNNPGTTNLLYKRDTDSSWITISNATSGTNYDRTFTGTAGSPVTIQAKCVKSGHIDSIVASVSGKYESGPGTINIPSYAVYKDVGDQVNQVYPPTAQIGEHTVSITSQSVYNKANRQAQLTIYASISIYDDSGEYSQVYANYMTEGIPIYFKIGSESWAYITVPFNMGALVGSGAGSQTAVYTLTQSDWDLYHSD